MKRIKDQYQKERDELFNNHELYHDPYKFCVKYSLLVEEYIFKILKPFNLQGLVAAVGSLSRRELSPYSNIDLMIILKHANDDNEYIQSIIKQLWDIGIEVSCRVRELSDIDKYLEEDLHSFTQFFETRFLFGNQKIYDEWNAKLFESIREKNKEQLITQYFEDIELRYKKYGNSAKILEPNIKYTGGGLRDIHSVEWMYSIKNQKLLSSQDEITQTEVFFKELLKEGRINRKAYKRLYNSYKYILQTRNILHIVSGKRKERLEFEDQKKIAFAIGYKESNWKEYMYSYFKSAIILHRFTKTMMKRYKQEFSKKLSSHLSIDLDDDYELIGDMLRFKKDRILSISDIMRAFYYKCLNDLRFEKNLRTLIIESIHLIEESPPIEATSSVFFRELLKLPADVGRTLLAMNEFNFLGILLPEFKTLNGFFQHGVYHYYTADEHSLIALQNLEKLYKRDDHLARLFKSIDSRDVLYLSVLLHDIGKPISVSGHEIIGAEIANSVMQNLGYGQSEIMLVQFLVRYHLEMEQVAFRRNINDPNTLDDFISIFPSIKELDYLYLLSYGNLSAVNPKVWTQWKADLLKDLYLKSREMLEEQKSGEELLNAQSKEIIDDFNLKVESNIENHISQLENNEYIFQFSKEEIERHLSEIENGETISVHFKENDSYTNISVITKDSDYLLAKLCGCFAINDISIHDAKIFTRNDGVVIDSFNVTKFSSGERLKENEYENIRKSINQTLTGKLNIDTEIDKLKDKWEKSKIIVSSSSIKVDLNFEEHERFTIIDIYAPDHFGLLYTIAHKLSELGLKVYHAKISTKEEGVLDAFYVQKYNGEKLQESEYGFIKSELIDEINKLK